MFFMSGTSYEITGKPKIKADKNSGTTDIIQIQSSIFLMSASFNNGGLKIFKSVSNNFCSHDKSIYTEKH